MKENRVYIPRLKPVKIQYWTKNVASGSASFPTCVQEPETTCLGPWAGVAATWTSLLGQSGQELSTSNITGLFSLYMD